jgi:hypothetical protein
MSRILAFGFILFAAGFAFPQQTNSLSARQILDKMVSVYASCSSYADKGEQQGLESGRLGFSTAFVRPERFRFEYQRIGRLENYVIWQDKISVRSWFSVEDKVRYHENLPAAIGAAAGVSRNTAVLVPSLLFGDLDDRYGRHARSIQTLAQLVLLGEEKTGGRLAYKIEGTDSRNDRLRLWIDKESFLLLKFFGVAGPVAGEIITYQPRVNIIISPGKLAFKH